MKIENGTALHSDVVCHESFQDRSSSKHVRVLRKLTSKYHFDIGRLCVIASQFLWTSKSVERLIYTLRKRKARALPRTHYAAYRRSLSMVEASKISHSVLSMSQLDRNCVGEGSSSVIADDWFGPVSIVRLPKYKPRTVSWESRSRKLATGKYIHPRQSHVMMHLKFQMSTDFSLGLLHNGW